MPGRRRKNREERLPKRRDYQRAYNSRIAAANVPDRDAITCELLTTRSPRTSGWYAKRNGDESPESGRTATLLTDPNTLSRNYAWHKCG